MTGVPIEVWEAFVGEFAGVPGADQQVASRPAAELVGARRELVEVPKGS